MNDKVWDEAAFRASIPRAREQVELAARFYSQGPGLPDWESHRPVVEFMFYLAKLDYDLKVLLCQLFSDSANRAVWEPYLALELHTALQTIPKAISRARIELAKPTTASHLNLSRFDRAATQCRKAIKEITRDKEFIEALGLIRNGVAAHHGLTKKKGMDENIAWTLTSWRRSQSEATPFESQIAEYAVRLGLAIQDFGNTT